MQSKICGISDSKTLKYIIDHSYPSKLIGFIVNYPKSKRFVEFGNLKKLLKINKKNSKYVAVLVKPKKTILEKIKNLPFDYYQIYDSGPNEIKKIKKKYNKKIIIALTIKKKSDVIVYKKFLKLAEIFLFDSKGYERSLSFDHSYLDKLPKSLNKMIAGNIKIEDLYKFKNTSFIIDVSGGCENDKGEKDINKIDKFLNTVHNINS